MKKLLYRINSTSLRNRLMLVFALFIIVPLIVQGFVSLSILSDSVLDRYQSEMDYRFSQMEKQIDSLIVECREVLFDFAYKKEIQTILKNEYQEENLIQSRYVVEKMLLDGKMDAGIAYSIFVYDNDGNCYTNDYLDMLTYEEVTRDKKIVDAHIYSNAMFSELMREQNYDHLIMGRPIFDEVGRNRIGTVVIRIDTNHIKKIFNEVFDDSGATVTVVDSKGHLVAADSRGLGSAVIQDIEKDPSYFSDRVVEHEENIVFISDVDSRDWPYIAQVSRDMIVSARWGLQLSTYVTILIVFGLSVLVLLYFNSSITHPIRRLTESIEAVDSAETAELTFKPKYNDEIGRMARSYNSMTYKLKTSVEKIKHIEQQKQRAEIKMLEAQISPHFLYNTISSIIWLVYKDKKNDAIEMMESLAKLYQISLSRGKEFITVEEEFCHVQSYLTIQERRYRGDFSYDLRMDPDVEGYRIIKVILQPLIENAIYHGIKNKSDGGEIIVSARKEDENILLFEVMDNGNMLGEEGCRKMNAALASDASEGLGVGVSNVMARLRLFYGDECSMEYRTRDGFTVVTICIPIKEERVSV